MKIKLEGVQETLLIPLAARVYETKSEDRRINDLKAVEVMAKLEYDFEKFNAKMSQEGVIARTIILDREVQKMIDEFPNSVCISIGCGLDTRYHRIRHGQVEWYNIDFPEVIALRKKLLYENKKVHLIARSALDMCWTEEIEHTDKKVIIVIEGMLMYLKQEDVIQLFCMIKNQFPNCIILAEIMHPFIANCSKWHDTVKYTNATFQWGISSGKDMEKLCKGLQLEREWNLFDEIKNRSILMKLASKIPFVRTKNNKIVKLVMK